MARGSCIELVKDGGQEIPCGRQKSRYSTKRCPWHWLLEQPPSIRDRNAVRRRDEVKQDPASVRPGDKVCSVCAWAVPTFFMGPGARCIGCEGKAKHERHIVNTYDLALGDYDALHALQLGKCAICRRRQIKKRLATDHDHPTDVVRGLLCQWCNQNVLGSIGGDTDVALPIARALVYYLEHHPNSGRWRPPEHQPEFGFPEPKRDTRTLDDLILGNPDPAGMRLAPF